MKIYSKYLNTQGKIILLIAGQASTLCRRVAYPTSFFSVLSAGRSRLEVRLEKLQRSGVHVFGRLGYFGIMGDVIEGAPRTSRHSMVWRGLQWVPHYAETLISDSLCIFLFSHYSSQYFFYWQGNYFPRRISFLKVSRFSNREVIFFSLNSFFRNAFKRYKS